MEGNCLVLCCWDQTLKYIYIYNGKLFLFLVCYYEEIKMNILKCYLIKLFFDFTACNNKIDLIREKDSIMEC